MVSGKTADISTAACGHPVRLPVQSSDHETTDLDCSNK